MPKKDTQTFEGALARLEEIVSLLESGDIPLDKSLDAFEEGVKLVKQCNSQLEEVDKKISILKKGQDSLYELSDFEAN